MSKSQQFHVGDIVSITDGRLVSKDGIDGVYRILNFMTGESLFTHQLPRASRECGPNLERQLPWTSQALIQKVGPELFRVCGVECGSLDAMVAVLEDKFGAYHEVEPLPAGTFDNPNPLAEMVEMMGRREQ